MAEPTTALPPATPAAAMWFGRASEPAFGMIHRPDVPRGHGVVVCNTLGFEGLVAHRPLRHLGESLAAAGLTVLRVDPRGTGDAAGTGNTPRNVASVLDDLEDAVDLLRGPEGCDRISIIGVRAGALLATTYALRHEGVENLVLWAPADRGRSFARELKALGRLSAAARPTRRDEPADPGELEVVGFEYPAPLLDDLASIDLTVLAERAPAPRVLLLERDDQSGNTALVDALAGAGATIDRAPVKGWADFMVSDETTSEFPAGSISTIATWLVERDGDAASAVAAGAPTRPVIASDRLSGDGFDEWSVRVGGELFAIVTEPATDGPHAPTGQVVILANTGTVNRTGPGRLYVHQARAWARTGITSVRVDLRGIGDTPAAPGKLENLPYSSDRISELLAVIEWARGTLAPAELTLFGICSAAYQSFQALRLGTAVDRAILVNQSIFYVGPGDALHDSTSRDVIALSNLGRWSFVRDNVRRGLTRPAEAIDFLTRAARSGRAALSTRRGRGDREANPEPIVADLDAITGRGVEVHFVFSANEPGMTYLKLFARNAIDRLAATPAFAVHEVEGGDHVFACPAARRDLERLVSDLLVHGQTPALSNTSGGA